MGILVEDNEEKSDLQRRIAADLRERSKIEKQKDYDPEDSTLLEGTEKTGRFSWFWAVLVGLAILSLIVIFFIK